MKVPSHPRTDAALPPWIEPEGRLRHQSGGGEVAVWFPAPLVIVYKYRGFPDASHARFIEETFDQAFGPEQRNIHLFSDTEQCTGDDVEFRRLTAQRALRIASRTDTYCLLVRSRIVALSVQMAGLLMRAARLTALDGRINVVTDRAVFQSRLAEVVRKARQEGRD